MDREDLETAQRNITTAREALLDPTRSLTATVGLCQSIAARLKMLAEERWLAAELQGYGNKDELTKSLDLHEESPLLSRIVRFRGCVGTFYVTIHGGTIDMPYHHLLGIPISRVEQMARDKLRSNPGMQWQLTQNIRLRDFPPREREFLLRGAADPEQLVTLVYDSNLPITLMEGLRAALSEFLGDAERVLLIERAKLRAERPEFAQAAHGVQIGTIQARQVIIGDQGTQHFIEYQNAALDQFLVGVREIIAAKENIEQQEKRILLEKVISLEQALRAAQPDPLASGEAVRDLAIRAPWLRSKLEELVVGAAASALGAGIIEGIRLGLTYLH